MELAASPSFIRNISSRRQLSELMIPIAFVKENPTVFHGCTSVILQVPGGQEYKVILKRSDNRIALSRGWKDFANHYALNLGYFLVFYHRGSSRFQVGIADTSNCEIDYTPFHCQHLQQEEDETEEEEDGGDNTEVAMNKGKGRISVAFERAEMCKCDGPSFTVEMNPSYALMDCRMWVPIKHGHRYMKNGNSMVKLVVKMADGGKATTKVKVSNGPNSVRFGAGWNKFVQRNRLGVDDVCRFELLDRETQTYLVHIFKCSG